MRRESSSNNDALSKRHTIHVENPNEQQRQSRRALNLNEDVDFPQERSRAQSQGRRPVDATTEPRTMASNVLLSRALRTSDEQVTRCCVATASSSGSLSTTTTSIPEYRTSETLSRTLSTSPSNSVEAHLGNGELYTALYTYSPARDDELALIQGDQYTVLEKHLDGWFKGFHVRSQQTGVFPGNYVKPSGYVCY